MTVENCIIRYKKYLADSLQPTNRTTYTEIDKQQSLKALANMKNHILTQKKFEGHPFRDEISVGKLVKEPELSKLEKSEQAPKVEEVKSGKKSKR